MGAGRVNIWQTSTQCEQQKQSSAPERGVPGSDLLAATAVPTPRPSMTLFVWLDPVSKAQR